MGSCMIYDHGTSGHLLMTEVAYSFLIIQNLFYHAVCVQKRIK